MNRAVVAHHEAGHAIAALQLGVGIGRAGVSIVPSDDFNGFVHVLKGFRGRPDVEITGAMKIKAEHRVMVCLAGSIAQRKFRPSSVRAYHSSTDRHNACDLLLHFTGGSIRLLEAYLRYLHVRTEELVYGRLWWTMIEGVAAALLTHNRLTANETKAIARDALGLPVPKYLKPAPTRGKGK